MVRKMIRTTPKFLRLLLSFAAAVWAMRASLNWIHAGAGIKLLGGWLVLVTAGFALGMAVNEEVRRDVLRE